MGIRWTQRWHGPGGLLQSCHVTASLTGPDATCSRHVFLSSALQFRGHRHPQIRITVDRFCR